MGSVLGVRLARPAPHPERQAKPRIGWSSIAFGATPALERDVAFFVDRLVAFWRSVTRPVGSFGNPALFGASLIAMVIVVALIALIYIVPRGGRRRR